MAGLRVCLGQVAYEGYRVCSDGKSLVSGAELPAWDGLTPEIREAWRAAADAVVMFCEPAPAPALDECGEPFPCAHRAHNPECNHPSANPAPAEGGDRG